MRFGEQSRLKSLSSCLSCLWSGAFVVALRSSADAISTVNGSPPSARADADFDVGEPGRRQHPLRTRRRRIRSRRSPSFARTHSSRCARRSRTRTRPPGVRDARRLARPRAPARCAWWSACDSIATSTDGVLQRQLLELALLPDDVRRRAAAAPSAARSSTASDRSTAITRDAQRAASMVR